MDFRELVINNNHPDYTAVYGWQRELGDATFTFGYICSYKEAADTLVDSLVPDLYIFPIMFCYRQYLELLLKNICEKHLEKINYQDFIYKVSHDLSRIWDYTKPYLMSEMEVDKINFIEQSVLFFYNLDTNSFTFRYEKDKKLNRSIQQDYLTINTLKLKEYMNIVDLYLRHTYDSL